MEEMIPFFSVVTCTYNRAGLISRALDSLLAQSWEDWECIIVDDDSTDNTREVVKPYLGARIRYIHHTHRGCALSKNAGLEAARGRYITFLDSDDEYLPSHLAIRQQVLEAAPETDLLYSDVKVIGNAFVPDHEDPKRQIPIADCTVGGTFVLRQDCIRKYGGFEDVPLGDDARLMKKLEAAHCTITKIQAPTYVYHRDSPDSMCTEFQAPS
jgi:glycosyltransferase involved in cell wall biosynthesis